MPNCSSILLAFPVTKLLIDKPVNWLTEPFKELLFVHQLAHTMIGSCLDHLVLLLMPDELHQVFAQASSKFLYLEDALYH